MKAPHRELIAKTLHGNNQSCSPTIRPQGPAMPGQPSKPASNRHSLRVFQAIIPSFSNNGKCDAMAHRYMTLGVIISCSVACFLSSFTDSFVGEDGKLYYGIATFNGLYVFNDEYDDDLDLEKNQEDRNMLKKYGLTAKDLVHACCSLTLFLVMACSSFDIQGCFFPEPGPNSEALMNNLPLAAGIVASGLFMLFPTKRRGIGYADKREIMAIERKRESPRRKLTKSYCHSLRVLINVIINQGGLGCNIVKGFLESGIIILVLRFYCPEVCETVEIMV